MANAPARSGATLFEPKAETDNASPREAAECCSDPQLWVSAYGTDLFRFAMLRLGERTTAEDLVQDTFLAALTMQESFRGESSEKNWLLGILKNKISDYFRRRARETSPTNLEFLKDEHANLLHKSGLSKGCWIHRHGPRRWFAPEASLSRQEFWDTLQDCVEKLPTNIAQVYTMRDLEEASTQEICETLKVSPGNLWVMLHRARMALRRCLEANWFGQ